MRITLLAVVLFSFSPWAVGQHNCPEGLRYVGTLSGTGSESSPFDKRVTVNFPENATLDESFQQKNIPATNGKGGARSTMRAQDTPKGVLVIASGKEDKIYAPGWAVSDPELKAIDRDASGKTTRYQFGMKLFCSVGSGGANPYFAECSVNAEICYKPSRP
jgi:hypothetical protein